MTLPQDYLTNSILNLSYTHLPLHLRACFLYLGMYPEDYIIQRDHLVKQWIAEGFVNSLHGRDLEDVGRTYFNELVNRSMLQPSETEYGEVLSCTIHDMMLDLILRKCAEDNFVRVAYNSVDMASLLHGSKYKVRRLSLSTMLVGGATYGTAFAASLSQVRSFILFESPMPNLLWFKYLRVLIICSGEQIVDLSAISQLFQLRYLRVRVDFCGKIELPTALADLIYLETVDIADCELMKSIPSDIVHLPRLSHLVLPNFTYLPEGIENMKSLCTLQGLDLKDSSIECIKGLGKLTNMRKLSMRANYEMEMLKINALACSIGKLSNLESMCISGGHFEFKEDQRLGSEIENDQQLGSLSNPFRDMERLRLIGWWFCRVPKWMYGLNCLRFLELEVEETSTEEFHLLGKLPSLVHLHLRASEIPDERGILRKGLFPVLEFFYLHSWKDTTAYLVFQAGAMPNLRTLCFGVIRWGGTIPVGMKHLLQLQEIQLFGASDHVELAFRKASLVHPNRSSIKVCTHLHRTTAYLALPTGAYPGAKSLPNRVHSTLGARLLANRVHRRRGARLFSL